MKYERDHFQDDLYDVETDTAFRRRKREKGEAQRDCLRCGANFKSYGIQNRLCRRCIVRIDEMGLTETPRLHGRPAKFQEES